MRNLKRVLSLALATVMLLGMMVIGAGAADAKTEAPKATALTDLDKVVNKEAVNLMVDLGIIVGKPDGTFDPTGAVDRATMAKLITYIMMGDVSADLFEGTVTDLKDIDASWAKGYIKYCYANKIIGGDGQGSFFPTKGVTVAEASKMLLVAIGYDAKAQAYEGNSWSINVMRDAKIAGLLEGIAAKTNDPLTRDNAAKMILNALTTPTVKYETQYDGGVAYKANPTTMTSGTPNPTLGSTQYNLVKTAPKVLTANEGNTGSTMAGKSVIGGDTLVISSKVEDIGKAVVYYTFDKAGKNTNSSTAVVYNKVKVTAVPANLISGTTTSTNKNTAEWLTENNLKETAVANTTTPKYTNYYANGSVALAGMNVAIQGGAIATGDSAYVIDNNGDGVIDALVINTKTIDYVTGDVKTAVSGTTDTVYVPGVLNGYINVKNVSGYEGLKKDDVVFTTSINSGSVVYIEKAASFTGKLTGSNASTKKVLVDGTPYEISNIADAKWDTVAEIIALGYDKDITFWTDAAGKIACAKASSATATSKLAMVIGYQATGNNGLGDSAATAKLLMMDGTIETVDVSKDSTATLAVAIDKTANTGAATTAATFDYVTYTVDTDGKYILKDASATYAVSGALSNKGITPNKPASVMGTSETNGFVGNADTAFVTAKLNADKSQITGYNVVTGIAKAPAYVAGSAGANGYVVSKDNVAKLVFIVDGTETNSGSGDYLYTQTRGDATYSAADKTYTFEAFVNGVKENVVVAKKVYESTLNNNGLYKISVADGIVIGATPAGTAQTEGTGVTYAGGVIGADVSGTAAYWTHTEKTAVYVVSSVNGKNVVAAVAPDAILNDTNDVISVWGNDTTKVAEVVVITKTAMGDLSSTTLVGGLFTTVKYGKNAAEATAVTNAGTTAIDFATAATIGTGITGVTANDFLAFEVITAASKNYKITIKIEGVGTTVSPAVTLVLPAKTASQTVTSVAGSTTYKVLAGTTGLKYTVTITDGDTEVVQVYTQAVTIS